MRPGRSPARACADAVEAFGRMAGAARAEGISLIVVSAFRSLEHQAAEFEECCLKRGRREAVRWVAPPGYSEHHTGRAFDIGDEGVPEADDGPLFETTPAFRWLSARAGEFGFELSFPEGNPGRVSYEPWHWRFIGAPEGRRQFHPPAFRRWIRWLAAFEGAVRKQIPT